MIPQAALLCFVVTFFVGMPAFFITADDALQSHWIAAPDAELLKPRRTCTCFDESFGGSKAKSRSCAGDDHGGELAGGFWGALSQLRGLDDVRYPSGCRTEWCGRSTRPFTSTGLAGAVRYRLRLLQGSLNRRPAQRNALRRQATVHTTRRDVHRCRTEVGLSGGCQNLWKLFRWCVAGYCKMDFCKGAQTI